MRNLLDTQNVIFPHIQTETGASSCIFEEILYQVYEEILYQLYEEIVLRNLLSSDQVYEKILYQVFEDIK